MISYIHGILVQKTPTFVVVEAGGVGYRLSIPLSSFQQVGEIGDEVKVLSYLHAREDGVRLFGFATDQERDLFLHLITVSGVGPRIAQGVLSGIPAEDCIRAIQEQDIATLTRAPGIGKKTAERLVLELKDKIGTLQSDRASSRMGVKPEERAAVSALVSLGYKQLRAQEIVEKVIKKSPGLSVEDTIREALRQM